MSLRSPMLFLAMLFLTTFLSVPVANATALQKALDQIKANPPASPDSFDFIVIGDNQNYDPVGQPEVFKQMLQEFNILKPAFVIDDGDLILGGAAEGLPPQWAHFESVISKLQVPFFPVVGNHDVSDAASEQLYIEHMGPTRYTFRYGNSFFIVLDTEEVGALERLPDAQVDWLKQQLAAASDVKNIFLFMHQPFFTDVDELGKPVDWREHWANVADAIKGYPVRAAFAGHIHLYRNCGQRGGVQYLISGGAGVGGNNASEEEGNFNHYLIVHVRGDQIDWDVVKPRTILSRDIVTNQRVLELSTVRTQRVACEEIEVPFGGACDRDITITIENPNNKSFKSAISWDFVPDWTVTPAKANYAVSANGSVPLKFRIKSDHAQFPVPKYKTVYQIAQYGPPINVANDIPLVPTAEMLRAKVPVTPDADLSEWTKAQWVPLVYPYGFDPDDTDDLQSKLAMMYDDDCVYVAVRTTDNDYVQPYAGDIVWMADNIEFFLDKWHWGFTLTRKGPEVFCYEGVDISAETVNTDVKLGVKRDGVEAIYEAAIPSFLNKPLALKPGGSCRVGMIMNDLDQKGERHWLELMPGAGVDNNRAPKVKFLLK